MRQAARQITQFYDTALAECGLRITQYSVLAVLDRLGPSTVQEVADEMVMDRSTLGHNLRPLEREGLVVLGVDEQDRRTRRLQLTSKGRRRLAAARPLWKKAQQRFESRFGSDGAGLRRLLRRVVESAAE